MSHPQNDHLSYSCFLKTPHRSTPTRGNASTPRCGHGIFNLGQVPDLSFPSNQYPHQEPRQARTDYTAAAFNQAGWPAMQQQPTAYATDPRYPAVQQPFGAYPARGQSIMLQDVHESLTLPPLNMPQGQAHAGAVNPSTMAGSHGRPPNAAYPTTYNPYTEHPQQPASYHSPPGSRNLPLPIPAMGIDPAIGGMPRRASMSVDRTAPSRLSVHGTSPYLRIPSMASPSTYIREPFVSEPTIKKKRKRADPEQLKVLYETYNRTAFPTTEERAELARRLNMSARSVQIWFQNKRQAMRQSSRQASNAAPPTTSEPFPAAGSGPYGAHVSGTATVPCLEIPCIDSGRPTALLMERAQHVGRNERQATAETRCREVPGNRAGEYGRAEYGINTHL
ncbi:homeobox-domain-containing protein [Laetiporus sulphureus 93-53]|uniref:Homeobox-domain-containing protein n=1 Tax=Laetiporus sulphureus 93-53 TaxID=1314785 RepID=A0A165CZS8_9APHY|nr:homeobox-domain-containing protein [Laetiporus sulphureus 93-53]KZT03841.1 homeobox-domain-containing protein [Laetiporus sulphureus 93-53]